MSRGLLAAAVLALGLVCLRQSRGDELRYYEQNGITYCEVRRTADRPVPEAGGVPRPYTVYREQVTTEIGQTVRTYWTPVTEYSCESYWVNRWNPFAEPYQAYRYVPRTRWEKKTEVVRVPVTCRRLVPETLAAQTAAPSRQGPRQEVVARYAVSGTSAWTAMTPAAMPGAAGQEPVGGLLRFDGDPPRYGRKPAWSAGDTPR